MKTLPLLLLLLALPCLLSAEGSLLFLEAQGVAGYSSAQDKFVPYSAGKHDAMQKNSIGLDYIQKFSTQSADIGAAFLQMRVAYNDDKHQAQLQIYNAYANVKTDLGYFWAGHNRMAFGLASYWDTHGELLQPLPMYGFGFDRDWGAGFTKDTQDGDIKIALTSGTGMPLYTYGNWLATSRVSFGVLSADNYSAGLSVMGGKILDTMGYEVEDRDPKDIFLAGADFAFNQTYLEHKAEINIGEKDNKKAFAAFYRLALNLMEENKLKIEFQPTYTQKQAQDDYSIACGTSYRVNSYLTLRFMYEYTHKADDNRFISQVYYYLPV